MCVTELHGTILVFPDISTNVSDVSSVYKAPPGTMMVAVLNPFAVLTLAVPAIVPIVVNVPVKTLVILISDCEATAYSPPFHLNEPLATSPVFELSVNPGRCWMIPLSFQQLRKALRVNGSLVVPSSPNGKATSPNGFTFIKIRAVVITAIPLSLRQCLAHSLLGYGGDFVLSFNHRSTFHRVDS